MQHVTQSELTCGEFDMGYRAFDLWSDAREMMDLTKTQAECAREIRAELMEARTYLDHAIQQLEDYENANESC